MENTKNKNLNDLYQVVIINNPYDTYESSEYVRYLLSETWGMKLRGYKAYFPYGVLPNDHLDYISNHIIVCHKKEHLRPVASVKNITVQQCLDFNIEFPLYGHLFKGREEEYKNHRLAIEEWIASRRPDETAYSMGFTIEPELEKEEKKFLCDYIFMLFYYYYSTYKIPHVIHGISKRFKLDKMQYPMGFDILKYNNEYLSEVKTKAYHDVESDIMVIEDCKFKPTFIEKCSPFEDLWKNRIEILPSGRSAKRVA